MIDSLERALTVTGTVREASEPEVQSPAAIPVVPLDLFPLDGPASLLRWGLLDWFGFTLRRSDVAPGGWSCEADLREPPRIPLRGTTLDAVLRSAGVALGWDVREDQPAPVLRQDIDGWWLEWFTEIGDPVFLSDDKYATHWFAISSAAQYPEAVAFVGHYTARMMKG